MSSSSHFSRRVFWSIAAPSLLAVMLLSFALDWVPNASPLMVSVTAATEEQNYTSFGPPIMNAMGCSICSHLLANSLVLTHMYQVAKNIEHISPSLVEYVLGDICDPVSPSGVWVRGADIHLTSKSGKAFRGNNSAVKFEISFHHRSDRYCKRSCATAQNACKIFRDHPIFDDLNDWVAENSNLTATMDEKNKLQEKAVEKFCLPLTLCQNVTQFEKELNKALNEKDSPLRKEIEDDGENAFAKLEFDHLALKKPTSFIEKSKSFISKLSEEELQRLTDYSKSQEETVLPAKSRKEWMDEEDGLVSTDNGTSLDL